VAPNVLEGQKVSICNKSVIANLLELVMLKQICETVCADKVMCLFWLLQVFCISFLLAQ